MNPVSQHNNYTYLILIIRKSMNTQANLPPPSNTK